MSHHVKTLEDVLRITRGTREQSQRMMGGSRPTLNECGLWASVELLSDCIELLAEHAAGALPTKDEP